MMSLSEALLLLDRFLTNSPRLLAVIGTDMGRFSFECTVVDVSSEGFTIDQSPASDILEGRPVRSFIHLNGVTEFSYGDIREADPQTRQFLEGKFAKVLGVLTLRSADGDRFLIVEYDDAWNEPETSESSPT